jgi:AhpD family alkylhydroperoxidase
VLDVVKLVKYRPDFYGNPMGVVTQEAMRGASAWSVADRELMAAFVAKTNHCGFCVEAHSAVARQAYQDSQKVVDALSNLSTANLGEPLRATLFLLEKLTREQRIDSQDIKAVLAAGASFEQIECALSVCFSFNVIGRLADAFGFAVPSPEAFESGAKYLLSRGYR